MDKAIYDVKEGSSQSTSKEPLSSNSNDTAPSAEDLYWADSCLMKFTEASDSDWSSFKESLLEILNVPTSSADIDNNDHMEMGDNHTLSHNQSVEASFSMMRDDHSDFTDEGEGSIQEGGNNDVDVSIGMLKKKWLKGKNSLEYALLPDHSEFLKVEESSFGFDLGSLSFEPETSSGSFSKIWNMGSSDEQETSPGSIFKVWDLAVTHEQDEFTTALSSALGEPKSGADDGWQDSVDQMDHVIAGISGLSLGQSST